MTKKDKLLNDYVSMATTDIRCKKLSIKAAIEKIRSLGEHNGIIFRRNLIKDSLNKSLSLHTKSESANG